MIDAAAAWLGSRFQEGATWQQRVHGAGRRSHYSYNEIIMTGALRPHHRNIYCIIYSVSPLVQGERTHINLQARRSAPHFGCCLLRSRLSSSLSFIPSSPPPLPSSYVLWCFLCVLLLLFFFSSYLPSKPRRRDGPSAPRGLNTAVDALYLPPPS